MRYIICELNDFRFEDQIISKEILSKSVGINYVWS